MELNFMDEKLSIGEYIDELQPMFAAQMNTICKLMAKKAGVKIVDIRNMSVSEFQHNWKKFNDKYRLSKGKFSFLGI